MNLAEYIKDPEWAVAREIFNAKFESIVDAVDLMQKIKEEKTEFNAAIYQFNKTMNNLKVCLSVLAREEETLRKRKAFKESHIAKLIQVFVKNNTDSNLNAIRREIESSNEFQVSIVPEWRSGDGERMYGMPEVAYFTVKYTDTFYPFDCWDIDQDIDRTEREIEDAKEELGTYLTIKNELYNKYDVSTFATLLEYFEKKHGPLKADPKWASWSEFIEDDDDDDDDY